MFFSSLQNPTETSWSRVSHRESLCPDTVVHFVCVFIQFPGTEGVGPERLESARRRPRGASRFVLPLVFEIGSGGVELGTIESVVWKAT